MAKNKTPKTQVITLRSAERITDIFDFLDTQSDTHLYFVIPRDFEPIVEINFLKTVGVKTVKNNIKLTWVTQKEYFQRLLRTQGFPLSDEAPSDIKAQVLLDFSEKVLASKNPTQAKKDTTTSLEFKPKITKSTPQFSTRKIENLKDEKSVRGFYFFSFLGVIGLLLLVFFWISPESTITLKPKISIVPMTQNVIVSVPEAKEDSSNKTLPHIGAIFVETEVSGEETFPATDKTYDLTNARGKVTLFNETDKAKFFVPSRLESDEGVIVRTQSEVTIPPKTEGVPGKIIVDVVADEYDGKERPIGNRGNLEAGTRLFFPGLRKESRELYYAKANQGPLVGGSTLTHYFVGENDFELTQPILHETFRVRGIENLQQELERRSDREGRKYVLLDHPNLLISELTDVVTPDELIGNEQQTFNIAGKVRVYGIVFDEDSVIQELREKIEASQDHRKKILEVDRNSIEYRILEDEDFKENGWVKLSVSLKGIETLNLEADNEFALKWRQNLKKEIAGREERDAKGILLNHPEIEAVLDIDMSPFWNKNIPQILEQIELRIKEDL